MAKAMSAAHPVHKIFIIMNSFAIGISATIEVHYELNDLPYPLNYLSSTSPIVCGG
jgi:hypothetical protein